MAVMKFKHSYATQRLQENGFKIWHNSKRILKYPFKEFPHWVLPKLETKIKIGNTLFSGDLKKPKIITVYDDLNFYGIMISKRQPQAGFYAQKAEYFLTGLSNLKQDVGDIPPAHYVEYYPPLKAFKLIGKNASNEMFSVKTRVGQYNPRRSRFDTTSSVTASSILKRYVPQIKEEKPVYSEPIPEIVLGVTDDGKLVCIQEEKENPTIGIVGKKRFGKSILKHRILDQTYHKWNKKCIEINDVQMETDSYCQTWKPIKIFSNLDLINEVSIPLPMVYLHPKTRTLKNMIAKDETGFEVYWDYCEFIQDLNNIMKGKPEWNLVGSAKYLRNLLYDSEGGFAEDGLYYCKSYKEQEAVVHRKLFESKEDNSDKKSQSKIPDSVAPTILNLLKDVDNAKILDTSNNTKAKWNVQFPDGHKEQHYPWIACLIADLVPSIVTHNLKNYHSDFHPQYANFILNDLFRNQNENDYFRKNYIELFIFFDEILALVDSTEAVDTMKMVIRESGHSRIGFYYCTQYWDDVPTFIHSQTDYVISFNQTKKQAKLIAEDFGGLKHKQKELVNLKKGEFIIFSSNPIILYDEYGKRDPVEDEAIKATVFPPLSAHKTPKPVGA